MFDGTTASPLPTKDAGIGKLAYCVAPDLSVHFKNLNGTLSDC